MDPTRSILYQDSRYIPLKVVKLKNKAAYIRTLILPRDSGRKMKKKDKFSRLANWYLRGLYKYLVFIVIMA